MKFKIYNAENSPHTRVAPGVHEAHITVCRNGNVVLNNHLLKLLKHPERVLILEDEEYKGDLYIASSSDPRAFLLGADDKRGSRAFSSSTLTEQFEEKLGVKAPFIVAVLDEAKPFETGKAYPLAVKKVRVINKRPCKTR